MNLLTFIHITQVLILPTVYSYTILTFIFTLSYWFFSVYVSLITLFLGKCEILEDSTFQYSYFVIEWQNEPPKIKIFSTVYCKLGLSKMFLKSRWTSISLQIVFAWNPGKKAPSVGVADFSSHLPSHVCMYNPRDVATLRERRMVDFENLYYLLYFQYFNIGQYLL